MILRTLYFVGFFLFACLSHRIYQGCNLSTYFWLHKLKFYNLFGIQMCPSSSIMPHNVSMNGSITSKIAYELLNLCYRWFFHYYYLKHDIHKIYCILLPIFRNWGAFVKIYSFLPSSWSGWLETCVIYIYTSVNPVPNAQVCAT